MKIAGRGSCSGSGSSLRNSGGGQGWLDAKLE